MTRTLSRLALVASLCAAAPAFAEAAPQRSVETADLNLASSRGRDALDRRLKYAARAVCDVGQSRDLVLKMRADRCYRTALSAARLNAEAVIARRIGTPFDLAAR